MRRILALAVTATVLVGMSAPASAGSWKFELHNKTKSTISSFRTKEDGSWSENWLNSKVAGGETFEMDFGSDEGDCVVRTQVTFSDDSYFDYDVDYCKVKALHVYNDEIRGE